MACMPIPASVPRSRTAIITLLAALATAAAPAAADVQQLARERSELRVPQDAFARAAQQLNLPPDHRPGLPAEQMINYGRDKLLLNTTRALFDDALTVPRDIGQHTAALARTAHAGDLGATLRTALSTLAVAAARNVAAPPDGTDDGLAQQWGVPWLDNTQQPPTPTQALETVLQALSVERPEADAALDAARAMPPALTRLIVRLLLADIRARPWIDASLDPRAIETAVNAHLRRTGAGPLVVPTFDDAYRAAIAPFEPRVDLDTLPAAPVTPSIDLITATDLDTLAYGALLHTTLLNHAVEEFRAWRFRTGWDPRTLDTALDNGVRFETSRGVVRILGPEDDNIAIGPDADVRDVAQRGGVIEPRGAALIIDLGGNDTYRGNIATTGLTGITAGGTRIAGTIATVIDLDGDDTYDAEDAPGSIAFGFLGIATLADLAGNDTYTGAESSIATALHGVAILTDYAGDDTYDARGPFSQAAAHAGAALLIDSAGDDTYTADSHTQGFGGTRGVAAIVELAGNDRYTARPGVNTGSIYTGRSVSMAQGVGAGRRADFGDGHSLAGGFGFLIDAQGDDTYHAEAWAQGAGYWWGVGALEDFSGNDNYEADWYAMGAASHFSIGSLTDLNGNDQYNHFVQGSPDDENPADGGTERRNTLAVTRLLGTARDGSIAIAFDANGNDRYLARSRSLGNGDLGSVAMFIERAGNDRYTIDTVGPNPNQPLPYADDAPLGSVVPYGNWNNFRDDLHTLGLFLEVAGQDVYLDNPGPARDANAWNRSTDQRTRALGIDLSPQPATPQPETASDTDQNNADDR